jgi:hypothetical protein
MTSILKWKKVQLNSSSPTQFSVRGNVDTRVVTRYFWLPTSDDDAKKTWDRDDGETLEITLASLESGAQNHLGFACRAAPVDPKETALHIFFQVRQGNVILLEQAYRFDVSDPNTPIALADGISLA